MKLLEIMILFQDLEPCQHCKSKFTLHLNNQFPENTPADTS